VEKSRSLALRNVQKLIPSLRTLRVVLVAAVLSGCLLSSIPVGSVASGPMCALACCAGRAPHAAGSCMHGECHVDLKSGHNSHQDSHKHHVKPVASSSEPLCGLSRILATSRRGVSVADAVKDGHHNKPDPKTPAASSNTISKPCVNDCGGCASAAFSSSKVRNGSGFSYANYARPPSSFDSFNLSFQLIKQRDGLRRQSAPRPPPVFLV
jgi:hypothetical protein